MITTTIYDDGQFVREIKSDYITGIAFTDSKNGNWDAALLQRGELGLLDCFEVCANVADLIMFLADCFPRENDITADLFLDMFFERLKVLQAEKSQKDREKQWKTR